MRLRIVITTQLVPNRKMKEKVNNNLTFYDRIIETDLPLKDMLYIYFDYNHFSKPLHIQYLPYKRSCSVKVPTLISERLSMQLSLTDIGDLYWFEKRGRDHIFNFEYLSHLKEYKELIQGLTLYKSITKTNDQKYVIDDTAEFYNVKSYYQVLKSDMVGDFYIKSHMNPGQI